MYSIPFGSIVRVPRRGAVGPGASTAAISTTSSCPRNGERCGSTHPSGNPGPGLRKCRARRAIPAWHEHTTARMHGQKTASERRGHLIKRCCMLIEAKVPASRRAQPRNERHGPDGRQVDGLFGLSQPTGALCPDDCVIRHYSAEGRAQMLDTEARSAPRLLPCAGRTDASVVSSALCRLRSPAHSRTVACQR